MMRFFCGLFGHKVKDRTFAAYDPAFGGLWIETCSCGKTRVTDKRPE